MRRAACDQVASLVAERLPSARVTRVYDGPRGYELLVEHEGRHAEIRTKADVKKIAPAKRGRKA